MSVLIRGMELPTGCKFCAMMRYYPSNGNVWCNATNRRMQYKDSVLSTRQEFCPLVEVPTPHGRLIDADALIDTLGASDRDIYCKCVIEEDAPTVIEAEGSDT